MNILQPRAPRPGSAHDRAARALGSSAPLGSSVEKYFHTSLKCNITRTRRIRGGNIHLGSRVTSP